MFIILSVIFFFLLFSILSLLLGDLLKETRKSSFKDALLCWFEKWQSFFGIIFSVLIALYSIFLVQYLEQKNIEKENYAQAVKFQYQLENAIAYAGTASDLIDDGYHKDAANLINRIENLVISDNLIVKIPFIYWKISEFNMITERLKTTPLPDEYLQSSWGKASQENINLLHCVSYEIGDAVEKKFPNSDRDGRLPSHQNKTQKERANCDYLLKSVP